jgi:hypothetical protein
MRNSRKSSMQAITAAAFLQRALAPADHALVCFSFTKHMDDRVRGKRYPKTFIPVTSAGRNRFPAGIAAGGTTWAKGAARSAALLGFRAPAASAPLGNDVVSCRSLLVLFEQIR